MAWCASIGIEEEGAGETEGALGSTHVGLGGEGREEGKGGREGRGGRGGREGRERGEKGVAVTLLHMTVW